MSRSLRVPVADGHVVLSLHAIERYMERACRHDDEDLARGELVHLVRDHGRISDTPEWRRIREILSEQLGTNIPHGQRYLLLGDDVAFPVDEGPTGLVATTCIVRGGVSDIARDRRRERRQRRAVARREVRNIRAAFGDRPGRWR